MTVIVCIDDDLGMLFHGRRQSQDRILRQRVLALAAGQQLWMAPYSAKQFQRDAAPGQYTVDDRFLAKAAADDICFVETEPLQPYAPKIHRVILYRWNRRYPSDLKFDLDLTEWTLQRAADFAGSSHETITEEVYVR